MGIWGILCDLMRALNETEQFSMLSLRFMRKTKRTPAGHRLASSVWLSVYEIFCTVDRQRRNKSGRLLFNIADKAASAQSTTDRITQSIFTFLKSTYRETQRSVYGVRRCEK